MTPPRRANPRALVAIVIAASALACGPAASGPGDSSDGSSSTDSSSGSDATATLSTGGSDAASSVGDSTGGATGATAADDSGSDTGDAASCPPDAAEPGAVACPGVGPTTVSFEVVGLGDGDVDAAGPCTADDVTDDGVAQTIALTCDLGEAIATPVEVALLSADPHESAPIEVGTPVDFHYVQIFDGDPDPEGHLMLRGPEGQFVAFATRGAALPSPDVFDFSPLSVSLVPTTCAPQRDTMGGCTWVQDGALEVAGRGEPIVLGPGQSGIGGGVSIYRVLVGATDRVVCWAEGCEFRSESLSVDALLFFVSETFPP